MTDPLYQDGSDCETEKVTLRIPEEQVKQTDTLVEEGEFPSRSEVIRAALRQLLNARNACEKLEERQSVEHGGSR